MITPTPKNAVWQALGLAWEFGYLIVIPLVVFALGGRWLDKRYDTSPWMLLGGMVLAIVTTTILMVSKFGKILKQAQNDSTKGPK